LARHACVPAVDVGYAGLKDRHAITQQWFSVRRPSGAGTDWTIFEAEGVRILAVERHNRKLRRGAHRANSFRIALRASGIGDKHDEIAARVRTLADQGVPNYFGEQRFGRDGGNLDLAEAVFAGRRLKRDKRSIAISAARSYLFNQILDARVRGSTWNKLQAGDIANLDGSGSIFSVDELTDDLVDRCIACDVHPTGTLWGDGAPRTAGDVAAAELSATSGYKSLTEGLKNARIEASSRALRLLVHTLSIEFERDVLWLQFSLSKGGYATTVLRELF
jgi:tRNA pseudouridine13 synthase